VPGKGGLSHGRQDRSLHLHRVRSRRRARHRGAVRGGQRRLRGRLLPDRGFVRGRRALHDQRADCERGADPRGRRRHLAAAHAGGRVSRARDRGAVRAARARRLVPASAARGHADAGGGLPPHVRRQGAQGRAARAIRSRGADRQDDPRRRGRSHGIDRGAECGRGGLRRPARGEERHARRVAREAAPFRAVRGAVPRARGHGHRGPRHRRSRPQADHGAHLVGHRFDHRGARSVRRARRHRAER